MKGSRAKEFPKKTTLGCKAYALRLLSYRSRSKRELSERLKEKGFDAKEIEDVIDFLEGAGLIGDKALAEWLFQSAIERKYLGRCGIKALLDKRGVEREVIDETLSALTEDIEQDVAIRFLKKKLRAMKTYPEDSIKQRLWRMLHRRGFSPDVISAAIKSVKS